MSDFDKGFWVGAVMCGVVSAIVWGCIVGLAPTIRADAIDAGVAEWRIDPKTGDRSFHWIDNNESERE